MQYPVPSDTNWSVLPAIGIVGMRNVRISADRHPCGSELADVIDRFWTVRWKVPPGEQGSAVFIGHPETNLVLGSGRVSAYGVQRKRLTVRFSGTGSAFGMAFRPGAALGLLGGTAVQYTDRSRPLAESWGTAEVRRFEEALRAATDTGSRIAVVERHVRARLRMSHGEERDQGLSRVEEIVDMMRDEQSITRVSEVCRHSHLSTRSLQRLFRHYLGISPKWLLRQYRLQTAAARLAAGLPQRWTEIAVDLGYFDESHFARDFTQIVGVTPSSYARNRVRASTAAATAERAA
ncbi:helix-turn-helix domain-containing protein [Embleya hyalina]|uniref:AraC family transcriptional regulator n=1 Tax=Embleya hyalina TaxID=516124 RepID=A0A401YQQ6_9ACTN|nr:helix-turn-helix transcriptional regulator [Embleya hyalina]GCD96923.1 AraC family transcriptional regulator [Embleya hyalina]